MLSFEDFKEIESISIVSIGKFNPSIIQPYWLFHHKLIRENEAKDAVTEIIHNEISRFEIEKWLTVEVTRERFEIRTSKRPYFEPLRDIFNGIFSILKETPITSIGINNIFELNLKTEKNYFEFGNKLTPLSFWASEMSDPRLFQIEILESITKSNPNQSRRVKIMPSDKIQQFGVAIYINNHFTLNSRYLLHKNLIHDEMWKNTFKSSEMLLSSFFNQIKL